MRLATAASNLWVKFKKIGAVNDEAIELLKRLVVDNPDCEDRCFWCYGDIGYQYKPQRDDSLDMHKRDCPYLAAKAYLASLEKSSTP